MDNYLTKYLAPRVHFKGVTILRRKGEDAIRIGKTSSGSDYASFIARQFTEGDTAPSRYIFNAFDEAVEKIRKLKLKEFSVVDVIATMTELPLKDGEKQGYLFTVEDIKICPLPLFTKQEAKKEVQTETKKVEKAAFQSFDLFERSYERR